MRTQDGVITITVPQVRQYELDDRKVFRINPGQFLIRAPKAPIAVITDDKQIKIDAGADAQILTTRSGEVRIFPWRTEIPIEFGPVAANRDESKVEVAP